MSNDASINALTLVKKKLQKYTALHEEEKVKEYLHKLHKTSVTTSLLQETKIDSVVRQLASHKSSSYSVSAKILLKKWYKRNLLRRSSRTTKSTKTEEPTTSNTEDFPLAQNLDEEIHPSLPPLLLTESQSSDDRKQRKVLSLAQYLQSKKPVSPVVPLNSTSQNKLTETEIELINAQFNAGTAKLAVHASDPVKNTSPTAEEVKTRQNDNLWAEDDDDDDDDDPNSTRSIFNETTLVSEMEIAR